MKSRIGIPPIFDRRLEWDLVGCFVAGDDIVLASFGGGGDLVGCGATGMVLRSGKGVRRGACDEVIIIAVVCGACGYVLCGDCGPGR